MDYLVIYYYMCAITYYELEYLLQYKPYLAFILFLLGLICQTWYKMSNSDNLNCFSTCLCKNKKLKTATLSLILSYIFEKKILHNNLTDYFKSQRIS